MSIDPKNSERYNDPTCYQAMVSIAKEERKRFKPLVYICSPYAGDVKANTANAQKYCRFAYRSHVIPIAPHLLYPQFLNDADPDEREDGLFMGLVLKNIDLVWLSYPIAEIASASMCLFYLVRIYRRNLKGLPE